MNKRKLIVRINLIVILILILSILTLEPQIAQTKTGNTIYVSIEGDEDYKSIQKAINKAKYGDTIYVYSGTYFENVIVNKTINLIGEDKTQTIIDGEKKGDVLYLSPSSNYVNITGFTIQNSGIDRYDEGINIDSDFNRITDNIIIDCNCGISLDFWAHNCILSENTFARNIKGISTYSIYPNNNLIFHNNFLENQINAYDDSNSTWSNAGEGNYWDDYAGSDSNGDGIGDTPYVIPGGVTHDNYPLIEPHGTPGFGIIIVILAMIFTIYMLKKKEVKEK